MKIPRPDTTIRTLFVNQARSYGGKLRGFGYGRQMCPKHWKAARIYHATIERGAAKYEVRYCEGCSEIWAWTAVAEDEPEQQSFA